MNHPPLIQAIVPDGRPSHAYLNVPISLLVLKPWLPLCLPLSLEARRQSWMSVLALRSVSLFCVGLYIRISSRELLRSFPVSIFSLTGGEVTDMFYSTQLHKISGNPNSGPHPWAASTLLPTECSHQPHLMLTDHVPWSWRYS